MLRLFLPHQERKLITISIMVQMKKKLRFLRHLKTSQFSLWETVLNLKALIVLNFNFNGGMEYKVQLICVLLKLSLFDKARTFSTLTQSYRARFHFCQSELNSEDLQAKVRKIDFSMHLKHKRIVFF